jgi:hypothetical protein
MDDPLPTRPHRCSPGDQVADSIDLLEARLNILIAAAVDESPDDTILGFIPVDEQLQGEILKTLKLEFLIGTIPGLLREYPSVTAYALSVAAPIGMKEEEVSHGGFYNAWNACFGYSPKHSTRESLARCFNCAVESLGLPTGTISPDKPFHHKGGATCSTPVSFLTSSERCGTPSERHSNDGRCPTRRTRSSVTGSPSSWPKSFTQPSNV